MNPALAQGDLHVERPFGTVLPVDLKAEEVNVELLGFGFVENPENRRDGRECHCLSIFLTAAHPKPGRVLSSGRGRDRQRGSGGRLRSRLLHLPDLPDGTARRRKPRRRTARVVTHHSRAEAVQSRPRSHQPPPRITRAEPSWEEVHSQTLPCKS